MSVCVCVGGVSGGVYVCVCVCMCVRVCRVCVMVCDCVCTSYARFAYAYVNVTMIYRCYIDFSPILPPIEYKIKKPRTSVSAPLNPPWACRHDG